MHILTKEQKEEFSEILEELGSTLDITETQYNAAVKSYEAVGLWLSKEDSELAKYEPKIRTQGSFMLGTMIQPEHEDDDLDIDLVCQLQGKNENWTQEHLKHAVGNRLKAHNLYKEMLDEEGRRCWTLLYRQEAETEKEKYHMDILPSIVDKGYRTILDKIFSERELIDLDRLAIRITDNKKPNYPIERNHLEWLKSNPFGYGRWFYQQAILESVKGFSINEAVQDVPKYRKRKLPLQRVVQILKRHRDMMFKGHEHKPISIIITTLAAKSYNKEEDVIDALVNVIERMPNHIEEAFSSEHGGMIKVILNPVNRHENFADKWVAEPERQENFYKWMKQVKIDIQKALNTSGGLPLIQESFELPFGKSIVTKAFSNYGNNMRMKRESGVLKMAAGTGMLGTIGTTVKGHNFHGR